MRAKRFVSGGLIAVIAATMLTLTAGSASALTDAESRFVSLINKERTSRGKRALSVASDLVANARAHSARMADAGRIFHNDSLSKQIDNWYVLGENVGVGPTVETLHQAFMDSPHHKENILYRDYNIIGVGIAKGDDGYIYVTEVFAGRKSSTTTVRRTSSSSSSTTTTRASAAPRATTTAAAPAPRRPAARPAPKPAPQTVDLLVRMVGFDAASVDPSTGAASGS